MKSITVKELKTKLDNNDSIQVIDVREPYEVEIATINGENIPMGEVTASVDKFKKDIPCIVHCRSGARSASVIVYLEENHGYENLYNLEGGILAWADEIDTSLEKY